jgi:hypothetical protein
METYSRPSHRDDFEIAIVCALPVEFDAVSLIFDDFWDNDGDNIEELEEIRTLIQLAASKDIMLFWLYRQIWERRVQLVQRLACVQVIKGSG